MSLRMYPVSASRWAQLAATRHIDLTEPAASAASDPGVQRRAELALIQAYVDALQPHPASASN